MLRFRASQRSPELRVQSVIVTSLARLLPVAAICAVSLSLLATRPRACKAQVRILAASDLIRGTWGYNQDNYLAELIDAHGTETMLVRLVDEYASEAPPLSRELLTARSTVALRVRRDNRRDMPYGQLSLRAAPGDPIAVLPMPFSYLPQKDDWPPSAASLPCYRLVRR
jgi:hypothetical protein